MSDTPDRLAERIDALSATVDRQFQQVHDLFQQVNERFQQVDERFQRIDERFQQVDERFQQVDERFQQVDERFQRIDERFQQVDDQFVELRQEIAAEGARTRRHFDVMAEQMRDERNLVLDKAIATAEQMLRFMASNAADHVGYEQRLGDHDRRLSELESE